MVKRKTKGDVLFDIINLTILVMLGLIVLYPLYFVVIASISDPNFVNRGQVILIPKGVTLLGYTKLFQDSMIWVGYRNTFFYTLAGTTLDVFVTICAAYALSRRDLVGRKVIMAYFVFTMYFSGGLIPLFVQVNNMGLYNTRWILILLGMVSVYNLIIARTFFETTIPVELLEAAKIDGCSDLRFFRSVAIPLSHAVIAVLVVYYGVGRWNQYFNALIFVSKQDYYPLQIVLREILIQSRQAEAVVSEGQIQELMERNKYAELIKYGVIVVSSLPVMILYPFAQKFFVKGVMLGAVKG
ncbi:MAG: carbohydrate ABC transporter permease [Clostridiales bacterium]|nr:carbohydrate ABC transporter permease [Clostridiales bacterium]